jgi:hypothetical protein
MRWTDPNCGQGLFTCDGEAVFNFIMFFLLFVLPLYWAWKYDR